MARKEKTDPGALQRLKNDLRAGQLGPLYLFYGPESYLREHYLALARKKLTDGPAEAFNYHRFNAENLTMDALQNAVEAMPMLAEATMVQVDDVDPYKLPQPDRERLTVLLSDIPPYCHVFFVFDTVAYQPDRRQKKLHGVLEGQGSAVSFEKQSERELAAWIAKHFAGFGKEISVDLCRYLILRTGGTMTALRSEIEKVAAYAPAEEITKTEIDAVVEPVLEAYVFDMTDAIAAGRYDTALATLQTLFQLQQEPIVLLAAIGMQLRRIYCAQLLQAAGKGAESLMHLCGMGSYPAKKTMGYARRLSEGFSKAALQACALTDYRLKTSYDTPQRLLELLLLQLAQEVKHA